jgi:hypothetical protein
MAFTSGGYELAYRMLAAIARAVAVATADSMIPFSTDMTSLVWTLLVS